MLLKRPVFTLKRSHLLQLKGETLFFNKRGKFVIFPGLLYNQLAFGIAIIHPTEKIKLHEK